MCNLRVFQGCKRDVARVLLGCFKGVSRQSKGVKGHLTGISRMLQGCYKGVPTVLLNFYEDVVRLFYWCFNEVIRVLLGRHKGVFGCHKDVTRVFKWSEMQECHIRSDMSRVTSHEWHVMRD